MAWAGAYSLTDAEHPPLDPLPQGRGGVTFAAATSYPPANFAVWHHPRYFWDDTAYLWLLLGIFLPIAMMILGLVRLWLPAMPTALRILIASFAPLIALFAVRYYNISKNEELTRMASLKEAIFVPDGAIILPLLFLTSFGICAIMERRFSSIDARQSFLDR